MKNNLILLFGLIMMASTSMGQKSLDEIRIVNPLFEPVSLNELRDFQAYQEKHFMNPPSRPFRLTLNEKSAARYFKLKGTNDIVLIAAIRNEQSTGDWEGYIKTNTAMFSLGHYYSVEYMELSEARGAILVANNPGSLRNKCYYQNKKSGVTLELTYINNNPFEERLENMRRILKELKIEIL